MNHIKDLGGVARHSAMLVGNMKLGVKIGLGFLLVLLLTGIVAVFGWYGMVSVVERVGIVDEMQSLVAISNEIRQQEKHTVYGDVTGNMAITLEAVERLQDHARDLRDHRFTAAANKEQMNRVVQAAADYKAAFSQYVALFRQRHAAMAHMLDARGAVLQIAAGVRNQQNELLTQVRDGEERFLNAKMNDADDASQLLQWALEGKALATALSLEEDEEKFARWQKINTLIFKLAHNLKQRFATENNAALINLIIDEYGKYVRLFLRFQEDGELEILEQAQSSMEKVMAAVTEVRVDQRKQLSQSRSVSSATVEEIAERTKTANRLTTLLLETQISEKDVVFNQNAAAVATVQRNLDTLQTAVQQLDARHGRQLMAALTTYGSGFSDYVSYMKTQKEMAITMTRAADAVEAAASDANRDQQDKMQQQISTSKRMVLGASFAAIVSGIVISLLLGRYITQALRDVINNISTTAAQITTTVGQQEQVAAQQAAAVTAANTTMEELGISAQQSAEQANMAAVGAKNALQLSQEGEEGVDSTLQSMFETKQRVETIAQQISLLSEKTDNIRNITDIVADFSYEIKLLAMNAAVEAVRAGEYGRGFSVLAVETRKLADESKQSLDGINDLIDEIRQATANTVQVTDDGSRTVEKGMSITKRTADTFRDVAQSVGSASEGSQQISLNIQQQTMAIKQAVESMKSIQFGAVESEQGIAQIKEGIKALNSAAQTLRNMV